MFFVFFLVLISGLGQVNAQAISFEFCAHESLIDLHFDSTDHRGHSLYPEYKSVVINFMNDKIFLEIAPPHLAHVYRELQSGKKLRNQVDQMRRIADGQVDVEYVLVDDTGGLPPAPDSLTYLPLSKYKGKRYVWPGTVAARKKGANGRYYSYVFLGESIGKLFTMTRSGGIKAWEATVIHETFHTQMVGPSSKFEESQGMVVYGKDNMHRKEELIGGQAKALNEGFSNFYQYTYNPVQMKEFLPFFDRENHRYFVEKQSPLGGAKRLMAVKGKIEGKVKKTPVWAYRWHDIPGFFLLFSESTTTGYLSYFHQFAYGNSDLALRMIDSVANEIHHTRRKRLLAYVANQLALQMESFPHTLEALEYDVNKQLTSSMFPFALLDLVTHYGMTEEEFRRECRKTNPTQYALAFEAYWKHRNKVKYQVLPHLHDRPIRFKEAVAHVHKYFQQEETILRSQPVP